MPKSRKHEPPPMALKPPEPPPGWQPKATASRPNVEPQPEETAEQRKARYAAVFANCKPIPESERRAWDWEHGGVFARIQASKLPQGPGGAYWREIMPDGWNCAPKAKPDALDQRDVYGLCRRKCRGQGAILALVGERGTGKTMIAAQLIIAEAWEGRVAPYRKLTGLVADFKAIYSDFGSIDQEAATARRDALCKRRLLIIDETHEATEDSAKAMKVLGDILDRRYSNNVDTVLISNQLEAAFKKAMNDSILSRIMERGRIVPCVWPSWRVRIAEASNQ